jgi:hypothetical protein
LHVIENDEFPVLDKGREKKIMGVRKVRKKMKRKK